MNKHMVRQGDILLIKLARPVAADKLEPETSDPRGLVLAEGESSGHHHAVFGKGAKLFRFRDAVGRVLTVGREGANIRVVGGGSAAHPRHLPVSLAPGQWEVRIQRQWTSEDEARSRQVMD